MQVTPHSITKTILLVVFLCIDLAINGVVADTGSAPSHRYPLTKVDSLHNVILMIGDGMGMSHITSARLHAKGVDGFLEIDRLPVTGLVKTYSKDHFITDSAAAGTALATGYKTNNGVISRTSDGKPLTTILEAARDHGMATAIVVTSTITHATPAVFAAHNMDRRNEAEIAADLIHNNIDVLLGGGRAYFIPADKKGSRRTDDLDLISEAEKHGYRYVETREELFSSTTDRILGLFQLDELKTPYPQPSSLAFLPGALVNLKEKILTLFHISEPASNNQEPTLAEMTEKAIEILRQNDNGFFLMVEGSQIDWGGHANRAEFTIQQTLLFDKAVAATIKFARDERHTLVLVTADHETGGMALTGQNGQTAQYQWNTNEHTAVDVPIYAYGPQAIRFTGVMDNTDIPKIIGQLLDLKNFPAIKKTER